jgi:phage tail-like protein
MVSGDAGWDRPTVTPEASPRVAYDAACDRLRLDRRRPPLALAEVRAEAVSRLETIPRAVDPYGTRAFWDGTVGLILAAGAAPETVPVGMPAPGATPTDLALGFDDVLYVAVAGAVRLHDLRGRWEDVEVKAAGFQPWRLAADPSGGVWVLDRATKALARLTGLPPAVRPAGNPPPEAFGACPPDPDAPRVVVTTPTPAGEIPVALACGPDAPPALLTWTDADARLYPVRPDGRLAPPVTLSGVRFPYSLAWLAPGMAAVMVAASGSATREAIVFPIADGASQAEPVGDVYPLRNHDGGPFLHGLTQPPHYPNGPAAASAPLYRISLPSFAPTGIARNRRALDSGSDQTVWHQLYLEAVIPPHCGITVRLAATSAPGSDVLDDDWHAHRFGSDPAAAPATDLAAEAPRGAWLRIPSEIAFHPGLLGRPPEKDRVGLFTALIQRPGRRVRALRGRFLRVEVTLSGDGRSTPELAALRAYASRFSYADRYLPELYRETVFGPDADRPGGATPADFLERFLDNMEGILTPIEDRIAGSYLLTDPRTTPDDALEWLGSWVGVAFDPAYPTDRRRALLENARTLARQRGTVAGLALAIDLATGGAVTRGTVVLVEDFRLRRVFATILGADYAEEFDPLVCGTVASGNSYVGDTLILGQEYRTDVLALLDASIQETPAEQAVVAALFDGLANRVTVLVHDAVDPQDLGLIRRVVDQETPAHVLARVVPARYPFLLGVAALAGVDTYLVPPPPAEPVRLDLSTVGAGDLILQPPSLDPRLGGGSPSEVPVEIAAPVALVAPDPVLVEFGQGFTLDGSASRAFAGASIDHYEWTRIT